MVEKIRYSGSQSQALIAVVADLLPEQTDLLRQAQKVAEAISDPAHRAYALAEVAAKLPSKEEALEVFKEACDAAKKSTSYGAQATTLAKVAATFLPKAVPEAFDQFDEALKIAKESKSKPENEIASTLASALSPLQPKLLQQARNCAEETEDDSFRAKILYAIDAKDRSEAFEADEQAPKVFDQDLDSDRLKELAFPLPEEVASRVPSYLFSAALDTIKEGPTDAKKTQFLSALAPSLYPDLFSNALSLISETIFNPAYRAEALSNLVPYLQKEQLPEALELVEKRIPGQSHKTEALNNLIPHLPIKQLPQVLRIAQTQIKDLSLKAKLLKTLATRLAKEESFSISETQVQNQSQLKQNKHEQIEKILELLKEKKITDDKNKTEILIALTPQLRQEDFESACKIIETIQIESYKAQAISVLAQAPNIFKEQSDQSDQSKQLDEQLDELYELANSLQDNAAKAKALSPFIKHKQYSSIQDQVIKLAQNSITKSQKAEILLELACYSFPDQSKALKAIRGLNIPYLQAQYLERLVPYLHPTKRLEAENIAQEIQKPYYKAKALISFACRFPQVRPEAKNKAKEVKEKDFVNGIILLSNLAIEVPEILAEILENLEQKQSKETESKKLTKWQQQQILVALKPHLPIRIAHEIERERKKGHINNELWDRALKILRKEYREALSGGSFRNDAAQDEDLLELKDEIDALANMLLMRDLEPPVAVGILGGWGGGKSYIMHLMQNRMVEIRSEKVDKDKVWRENSNSDRLYPYVGHIYQIKFDSWTYAKSNLWASLMQTIFFELDRQITLEQQLVSGGIDPCEANSAKIWQVLYKTSAEDRKWFLERVLNSEQLENLEETENLPGKSGQLWKIFKDSQKKAIC